MPASTPRYPLAPALSPLVLLLIAIAGCSGRSENTAAAPEPPEGLVTSLQEEAIRQARLELERGESLARDGRWQEARLAFDRAVDLLLYLPGGVEASEEVRSLYNEVVATVHESERQYQERLADSAIDDEEETAAVDELTTDVSRLEEAEEVPEDLEPVSPTEADLPAATYDIPITINARVLSIIEMFQTQKREWFQEALDRGALYMPLFERVLEEEGVPKDLVYLSMIESAFKPRAVSRAGARGLWQFISGTGKLYGLRQDYWVDDRFDPERATRAAAKHLKDLYDEFGDWYLAFAAYNAGPRRIERVVRRTGIRDFWTLASKRHLPRETRSYVPLILAAAVIGKNPEVYGFRRPTVAPLEYDVVELEHPIDLETAARSAGSTIEEMKLLNPELRHWVTPLDRERYGLKIPKGSSTAFQHAIAAIPESERVRFGAHVVQRGDTLSRIAARYGTTLEALTSANRITARTTIHPGQVLTVPVPPGALAARGRGGFTAEARESFTEGEQDIYVVVRGDTLGAIADSFRMSLGELRALNDLPPGSSRIHPGQRLLVASRGGVEPKPAQRRASEPVPGRRYTVKPGDTLGAIAEAHGVSLAQLRRWNGMSGRATRIYAGQSLVVGEETGPIAAVLEPEADARSYRIRRGDTLSTIARRFGVSVEELRRWNRMSSDRIRAGQSITIRSGAGSQ